MSEKTFLMRLDDVVRWPGAKIWGKRAGSRRPLRWTSTIALIIAMAGFILLFIWPARQWSVFFVLIIGNALGSYMPIFGPLKPWGSVELVDERERALRAKSYLVALSALAVTGVFGAYLIIAWSMMAGWSIWSLRTAIIGLTLLMITIYTAGPTCIASWLDQSVEDGEIS